MPADELISTPPAPSTAINLADKFTLFDEHTGQATGALTAVDEWI